MLCAGLLLLANTGLASDKADGYYNRAIQLHGAQNLEKIFELYARSAELGHRIAQYNLAMMYSNGESVYIDYQQAVYWFRKSATNHFPPAQYRLAEMYYFEKGGLGRDLQTAIALFRQAAESNDPDAQMDLAMLCGSGEGLPWNTNKALTWMTLAGEAGNTTAIEYKKMLMASANGSFTPGQQHRYWTEKAAELESGMSGLRLPNTKPDGAAEP